MSFGKQNERKNKMKKLIMFAAVLAAVGMVAGCFTSARAYTETKHADGSVTVSKVNIIGTGDKASEIAAEGLFVDGTQEDLGAGVKTASANQKSTGIAESFRAFGDMTGVIAQAIGVGIGIGRGGLVAEAGGAVGNTSGTFVGGVTGSTDGAPDAASTVYSPDGFTGQPGPDGAGVYGRPSCSRCQAYKRSHPDAQIINIDEPGNRSAMWGALRLRNFPSSTSVALPVQITETGYIQNVK